MCALYLCVVELRKTQLRNDLGSGDRDLNYINRAVIEQSLRRRVAHAVL